MGVGSWLRPTSRGFKYLEDFDAEAVDIPSERPRLLIQSGAVPDSFFECCPETVAKSWPGLLFLFTFHRRSFSSIATLSLLV